MRNEMSPSSETAKKKRFHAVDVFLILLLVICLVGIAFRFDLLGKIGVGRDTVACDIRFSVEKISSYRFDAEKDREDVFFLGSSDTPAGTIAWTDKKAAVFAYDDGGNPIYYPPVSDDAGTFDAGTFYEVEGVLHVEGRFDGEVFYLGGNHRIAPGIRLTVTTERLAPTVLTVQSITQVER